MLALLFKADKFEISKRQIPAVFYLVCEKMNVGQNFLVPFIHYP
jgi:hypothetical protein